MDEQVGGSFPRRDRHRGMQMGMLPHTQESTMGRASASRVTLINGMPSRGRAPRDKSGHISELHGPHPRASSAHGRRHHTWMSTEQHAFGKGKSSMTPMQQNRGSRLRVLAGSVASYVNLPPHNCGARCCPAEFTVLPPVSAHGATLAAPHRQEHRNRCGRATEGYICAHQRPPWHPSPRIITHGRSPHNTPPRRRKSTVG